MLQVTGHVLGLVALEVVEVLVFFCRFQHGSRYGREHLPKTTIALHATWRFNQGLKFLAFDTLQNLLGARTLLGAPRLTWSKEATRNKGHRYQEQGHFTGFLGST